MAQVVKVVEETTPVETKTVLTGVETKATPQPQTPPSVGAKTLTPTVNVVKVKAMITETANINHTHYAFEKGKVYTISEQDCGMLTHAGVVIKL